MVMETVGEKSEFSSLYIQLRFWFFFFLFFLRPYQDYLEGFSFFSQLSFAPRQCISCTYNNNTNNRSKKIYLLASIYN